MFSTITEGLAFYKTKCREYVAYKIGLHETYGSRIPMTNLQDNILSKKKELAIMEKVLGLIEAEVLKIKNEFGANQFPEADPTF
jgi:hypothetical protein